MPFYIITERADFSVLFPSECNKVNLLAPQKERMIANVLAVGF